MFAPTKTWRKWHRKINTTEKRYAVCSALAATAVPALVMARGHKIEEVPEIPLVVEDSVESVKKTSQAKEILATVGALDDVEKAADSKQIRAGKGKARNRRYVMRKGPLIIYNKNDGVEQGFRNLPGVELCCVSRLNLLQLAPGGHMGRFCVWSKSAIEELETIYGDSGKRIPAACMDNADLARIINSDEIQSVLNPAKRAPRKHLRKKNPLTSMVALKILNPYAAEKKRKANEEQSGVDRKTVMAKRRKIKTDKKKFKAQGKKFFAEASKQGDICEDGFTV